LWGIVPEEAQKVAIRKVPSELRGRRSAIQRALLGGIKTFSLGRGGAGRRKRHPTANPGNPSAGIRREGAADQLS